MNSHALLAALLLGTAGSVCIVAAVRQCCSRKGRAERARPSQPLPQAGDACAEAADVYRQVFFRRIWALLLCLAALAAWVMEAGRAVCLLLAGGGCVMLYLAYRLRTAYVLRMTRAIRDAEENTAAATAAVPPKETWQSAGRETV